MTFTLINLERFAPKCLKEDNFIVYMEKRVQLFGLAKIDDCQDSNSNQIKG
jgi:hypothetical protein